jgi:hypothetical protein
VGIDGNCESTREADALAMALRGWCNEAEALRRRRSNTWSASMRGASRPAR